MEDRVKRAEARVGQSLREKWRLDALIGVGGMAAVYAATHRNGRRGAVKILHPEIALDDNTRRRFLREGYLANTVGHGGAVLVVDDDKGEDGSVFLVMELLEGEAVEKMLERCPGKKLDPSVAMRIGIQLCEVLHVAHQKGIVHRDLKPENLFLTRAGNLKVLDFGIAALRTPDGAGRATQTGSLMGTPAFMAPEQALGEWSMVDARTDIWAVGATLFTMLSGQCVHVDDTVSKVLLRAMTKPAAPLASVAPELHPDLCALVDRALAFDRNARWQSAAELGEALAAILRQASGRRSVTFDPLARTTVLDETGRALAVTSPSANIAPTILDAPVQASSAIIPAQASVGTLAATAAAPTGGEKRGIWAIVAALTLALAVAAFATWRFLDASRIPATSEPEAPADTAQVAEPPPESAPPPESVAPPESASASSPEPPSPVAPPNIVRVPKVAPPPAVPEPPPPPPPAPKKGFEGRH